MLRAGVFIRYNNVGPIYEGVIIEVGNGEVLIKFSNYGGTTENPRDPGSEYTYSERFIMQNFHIPEETLDYEEE